MRLLGSGRATVLSRTLFAIYFACASHGELATALIDCGVQERSIIRAGFIFKFGWAWSSFQEEREIRSKCLDEALTKIGATTAIYDAMGRNGLTIKCRSAAASPTRICLRASGHFLERMPRTGLPGIHLISDIQPPSSSAPAFGSSCRPLFAGRARLLAMEERWRCRKLRKSGSQIGRQGKSRASFALAMIGFQRL